MMFEVKDERKPMINTAKNTFVETADIDEANLSVQPYTERLSTIMNNPSTNGTIFHGILEDIAGIRGM